jgi:hypothetical protein
LVYRASMALAIVLFAPALTVSSASAQDMNLALSRLDQPCMEGGMTRCQDDDAYTRVMTQFAASLIPPVLTPAGTRGVRGIYIGFETYITGIDNSEDYWHRAVEGDGGGADDSMSRFVDPVLAWGRFNIRKGLPFGFELGANISYLANTTYWAPGLEIKWSLFEGFRDGVGWIPDFAVRAAVQTMVGDGEFNVTVPSLDFVLSEPFIVANTVEITPTIFGQIAWMFVDSELVDLSPETSAFGPAQDGTQGCNPDPRTPPHPEPSPTTDDPPYCRGDGSELNDNVVFPSLRSMRARLGAGLQIRYEWFTVLGAFSFDVVPPAELDSDLPSDLPRQWQVSVGVGVTL